MRTYTAADDRYATMPYRRCGRSGLRLPPVCLGLWQHCYDIGLVRALSCAAFDAGMTHFDLANNYGPPPGAAEEAFGQIMQNELAPYRDELVISTKAGYTMWPGPYGDMGSRKYLMASLEQSLRRMRLDHVDIFYHHRPDPQTPLEETIGALADIVRSGKARYAGISNYSGERITEAAALAKEFRLPLIINQVCYNMFNRGAERDVLPQCSAAGQGVIAFSPLAQGMLTDRYLNGIPADSRAGKAIFNLQDRLTDEVLAKVRALNTIAADRGQSLAEMALTWLLRHESVVGVIIGASRVEQLEQNLKACSATPLTDDELTAIETALA